MNVLSVSVISLSTASGAYLGYNSNLISRYENGTRKSNKWANAAIGSMTGFGVSYLVNLAILGEKLHVPVTNEYDTYAWLDKHQGKGFTIIDFDSKFDDFRVIPTYRKINFTFKSKDDFHDFHKAFGLLNQYYDDNVNISIGYLDRTTLLWLYQTAQFSLTLSDKSREKTEERIFALSDGITEWGEVARLIPRFRGKARELAYADATSIRLCSKFSDIFREWFGKAKTKAVNYITSLRTAREFASIYTAHSEVLFTRAEQVLSQHDLLSLAKDFEVHYAKKLYSGQFTSEVFYIPANTFAVISLREAPMNRTNLEVSYEGINERNMRDIKLVQNFTFDSYYGIKISDITANGRYVKCHVKNNGQKRLLYSIHLVEPTPKKRLIQATAFVVAKKLAEAYWGKNNLIYTGLESLVESILSWQNPFKVFIVNLGLDYFIDKNDLNPFSEIGIDFSKGLLLDIFKHIPGQSSRKS